MRNGGPRRASQAVGRPLLPCAARVPPLAARPFISLHAARKGHMRAHTDAVVGPAFSGRTLHLCVYHCRCSALFSTGTCTRGIIVEDQHIVQAQVSGTGSGSLQGSCHTMQPLSVAGGHTLALHVLLQGAADPIRYDMNAVDVEECIITPIADGREQSIRTSPAVPCWPPLWPPHTGPPLSTTALCACPAPP